MSDTLVHSAAWQSLPAIWNGRARSINRLLCLRWLAGRDPATLAATFNAVVYGHVLTPAELQTVLGGARTLPQ